MLSWRPRTLAPRSRLVAPALAATLALVVVLTGGKGVDLAAATYRVELFARSGLTLWDSQWYGGHWTFDYSVLFAPIGWIAGIPVMEIVCAAVAAWAFDRLAVARFGRAGRLAAVVFAIGTVVQVVIGQEPYLLGLTLGLLALVAARARLWQLSLPIAVASALASPLDGAFLGLAAVAWAIGMHPRRRWDVIALAAVALLPVAVLELLFPGQGTMPFELPNFSGMLLASAVIAAVAWRRERAIAAAAVMYGVSLVFVYAVPSAIGNNITRLGISFGLACVVALAQRSGRRARLLLVAAAVPLALAQWVPAAKPLLGVSNNASTHAAYFHPLLRFLRGADSPLGRVEVVPTSLHWEAAYVAPSFPLARGWERQLDTANNQIFYERGRLTAASYRRWLFANGVRFVALPDVPLDYAAIAEGRLVRRGVPGLREVWSTPHWRVFEVSGAPGLVSGPARLLRSAGADVLLRATSAGEVIVRERYVDAWKVARGHASVSAAPGGWLRLHVAKPGLVELRIAL